MIKMDKIKIKEFLQEKHESSTYELLFLLFCISTLFFIAVFFFFKLRECVQGCI